MVNTMHYNYITGSQEITIFYSKVFLKQNNVMIPMTLYKLSYEPPHGKTNNVVSKQVQHKLGCTLTEVGKRLENLDLEQRRLIPSE